MRYITYQRQHNPQNRFLSVAVCFQTHGSIDIKQIRSTLTATNPSPQYQFKILFTIPHESGLQHTIPLIKLKKFSTSFVYNMKI